MSSLLADFPIRPFQKNDVQKSKQHQILRHDPYANSLLEFAKHCRHKGAAKVSGSHLQPDYCRVVFFPEIVRGHVLDCRIDRPHPCTNNQKTNCGRKISFKGQRNQPIRKAVKTEGEIPFYVKSSTFFPFSPNCNG